MHHYAVTWLDQSRVLGYRTDQFVVADQIELSDYAAFQNLIIERHNQNVVGRRPRIIQVSYSDAAFMIKETCESIAVGDVVVCLVGGVSYQGAVLALLGDVRAGDRQEIRIDCGLAEARIFPVSTVIRVMQLVPQPKATLQDALTASGF